LGRTPSVQGVRYSRVCRCPSAVNAGYRAIRRVSVKIVAGESFGKSAKQVTVAPFWYFIITLAPGASVFQPIPQHFSAFAHVLEGAVHVSGRTFHGWQTVFFARDGARNVALENCNSEPTKFLLIAGDPLEGQAIHQQGPFVATSRSGIQKAFTDYTMVCFMSNPYALRFSLTRSKGMNGFETARRWSADPVHDI
jgi:quercetin 2,3-dioxygenase